MQKSILQYKINIKNIVWMYSYIDNIANNYEEINGELANSSLAQQVETLVFKHFKRIINSVIDSNFIIQEVYTQKPKGRINFTKSSLSINKNEVYVDENKFTLDTKYNQILKYFMNQFYKNNKMWKNHKYLFNNVQTLNYTKKQLEIFFKKNQFYNKGNLQYKYLFKWFQIIISFDNNQEKFDSIKLDFDHNQFEKFVVNYYKKHLGLEYTVQSQKRFRWICQSDNLGTLISDIAIYHNKQEHLLIDTKFYKNILTTNQYNKKMHKMHNLYQMNTYLTNSEFNYGIILYATDKYDQEHYVEVENMFNKIIKVKTLNLNESIENIKNELSSIIN